MADHVLPSVKTTERDANGRSSKSSAGTDWRGLMPPVYPRDIADTAWEVRHMAAAARFREWLFRVCPRGPGGGGTLTAAIEGGAFTGAIGSIGHEESEPVFTHTIGSKRKKHRSSLQVTGKADPATAEGRSHPHRRLIVDRDIGDAEGAPLLEAVAVSSPRHHAQQVASSVLRQRKGKVAVAAPVIEGDMDVVADTGRRERAPVERYDLAVLENRCTHVTFAERRVDEVRVEFELRTHDASEQLLFIAPMEQPGAKAWDDRFRQRSRGNRSTIDAIQVKPRHLVQAPDQLMPDRGDQAPTLAIAQIARLIVALEFQHHLSRMLPDTQPLFNPPTGGCVSWLRHRADAPAARRSQQRRNAYLGGCAGPPSQRECVVWCRCLAGTSRGRVGAPRRLATDSQRYAMAVMEPGPW